MAQQSLCLGHPMPANAIPSGAYWSGERPTTGSEDFDIKRGGPAVFIMECRRNNEFINQAVQINVNKTLANNFIFDVQGEVDFTVDYPAGTQPRVTGLTRGDFNDDNIADTFIGVEYRDIATEALVDVGFIKLPVVLSRWSLKLMRKDAKAHTN